MTDYVPAEPRDLQIVCNRISIEAGIPEEVTDEVEFVFQVTMIAGHPQYQQATNDSDTAKNPKGPYTGFDISVYHVDDSDPDLALEERVLWPACLPKASYQDTHSIFVSWKLPEPEHTQRPWFTISQYQFYLLENVFNTLRGAGSELTAQHESIKLT